MADVINDSAVKVTLKHPIESEGATLTEITCRRPTARQLRGLPVGALQNVGQLYPVLAACCNIPECDLDRLDIEDFGALLEGAMGFFLALTGGQAS